MPAKEMTTVSFGISEELKTMIRIVGEDERRNMANLIRIFIEEGINKRMPKIREKEQREKFGHSITNNVSKSRFKRN